MLSSRRGVRWGWLIGGVLVQIIPTVSTPGSRPVATRPFRPWPKLNAPQRIVQTRIAEPEAKKTKPAPAQPIVAE